MREIIGYVISMLPYMLYALPVILVLRAGLYLFGTINWRNKNLLRELLLVLFFMFLTGLFSQALLPVGLAVSTDNLRYNLIPLNKIYEIRQVVYLGGNINYFLIEFLGNIGMFAIIGFTLPLLWKQFQSFRNTVLACFSISLIFELGQLVLPRATDVDDLIMNTLGGIIGFLGYLALKRTSSIVSSNLLSRIE